MSLKTWKEEFYPIPADEADYDPMVAAEHSLQKWIGLRKENLAKHEVVQDRRVLDDGSDEKLEIDADSCSLCQYSFHSMHGTNVGNCTTNCPLGKLLAPSLSAEVLEEEDCNCATEYVRGIRLFPDVELMIKGLERTVEFLKGEHEFPSQ